MWQTSLSVWFVCRLCRGSFGQVDAFIEHKKQKHFTQFQNTTSIAFEERELLLQYPVVAGVDHQLVDKSIEPPIKVEVNNEDPIIPFSSTIIDEPNLVIAEVKNELITYESEINPDYEKSFFGLNQPEQNPYVLIKRLMSEEIESACFPQHQSTLLKCEQKQFVSNSEPPNLSVNVNSSIGDPIKSEKSTDNQPSAAVTNTSQEPDLQFECKLCSKQLQSDAQLKIHVGICGLYHKDQNRFCVKCNRKFYKTGNFKKHRLRFHGTEEEKSSLYKFKCHLCPKKYRESTHLRFHLRSHQEAKQNEKFKNSNLPKCSHQNCGKVFRDNSGLRKHVAAVHLGARPFSCHFPNCNKTFAQKPHMVAHFMTHTGERPYKCTVDNCNQFFATSDRRSHHLRHAHRS